MELWKFFMIMYGCSQRNLLAREMRISFELNVNSKKLFGWKDIVVISTPY